MTFGTKTAGVHGNYPFYFYKTWNGVNGKYTGVKLNWNDYSCTVDQVAKVRGTGDYWWGSPGGYIPDDDILSENGLTWTANDENKLLSRLAEKARGHQFNLGVALGESKETMDMVVHNVRRITGALVALKRGRFDLAARHLGVVPRKRVKVPGVPSSRNRSTPKALTSRDVSAQWLELQYGWLPLIGDCYEGMRAFAVLHNKARTSTLRVSSAIQHGYAISAPPTSTGTPWNGSVQKRASKRIICEFTEQLTTARSLGLQDPRSIVWELVPFSFVADWFVPIGSYLDNLAIIPHLNARFLINFRYSCSGGATGNVLKCGYLKGTPPTCYPDKYWYQARVSATHLRMTRTSSTTLTVPQPEFVGFEEAFSPKRLANAVALLHQTCKSVF